MPDFFSLPLGQQSWKEILIAACLYGNRDRLPLFPVKIAELRLFFSDFQSCNDVSCLIHILSPPLVHKGKQGRSLIFLLYVFCGHGFQLFLRPWSFIFSIALSI